MLRVLALGFCCMSANVLLMSLGVFIRRIPETMAFIQRLSRWGLLVSYRAYRTFINWVAPILHRWTGVDLRSSELPRMGVTTILSVGLGLGLLALVGLPVSVASAILFGLHGLLVGGLWDELEEPGGIRLGERIQ